MDSLKARVDHAHTVADTIFAFCQHQKAITESKEITPYTLMKDGSYRPISSLSLWEKLFYTASPTEFVQIIKKSFDNDTHKYDYLREFMSHLHAKRAGAFEYNLAIKDLHQKNVQVLTFKDHFDKKLKAIASTLKTMNFVARFFAVIFCYGSQLRALQSATKTLSEIDARLKQDIETLTKERPPEYILNTEDNCTNLTIHAIPLDSHLSPEQTVALTAGKRAFLQELLHLVSNHRPLIIYNDTCKIRTLEGASVDDAVWIREEIKNFNAFVLDFLHTRYGTKIGPIYGDSKKLALVKDEIEEYKDNNTKAIPPDVLSNMILRLEMAHQLTSKEDALDALKTSGYDEHLDEEMMDDLAEFLLTQEIYFTKDLNSSNTDFRLTKSQKSSLNEAFVTYLNQGFFTRLFVGIDLNLNARAEFTTPEAIIIAYTDRHQPPPQKVDLNEALILVKKLGYYNNTAVGRQFAQYLVDQGFELTYFASLLTDEKIGHLACQRAAVMKERAKLSTLLFNFMLEREKEGNLGRNGSAVFKIALEREKRLSNDENPNAILPTAEEFEAFLEASNPVQKAASNAIISQQPLNFKTVAEAQQAIACSEAARRRELKHQDNFFMGLFRRLMV